VDASHCPTEFIKNVIEKHGYTKPKYVISNGVAEEYVCRASTPPQIIEGKFSILTVGRLGKEKQHAVLIDAIYKSKHEKEIQLICAGDGPLKSKLIKQSKKLTNQPIFKFFKSDELVTLFNTCSLYVHPADVELEGIACIEAISCGIVPIVSNSPRCATKYFALTEDNLFACNDSDDLAKKIDYLIDNPARLAELKELYVPKRGAFSLSHSIDLMEDMFEKTIAAVQPVSFKDTDCVAASNAVSEE
jgi:glycosyltransferase involved in cell wall biosynthesis